MAENVTKNTLTHTHMNRMKIYNVLVHPEPLLSHIVTY